MSKQKNPTTGVEEEVVDTPEQAPVKEEKTDAPQKESTPEPAQSKEVVVEKVIDNKTTQNLTTGQVKTQTASTPFTRLVEEQNREQIANQDIVLSPDDLAAMVKDNLGIDVSRNQQLSVLVKRLAIYHNEMGPASIVTGRTGVDKQQDLYNAFISILNEENEIAQAGLKILQFVFTKYKYKAFSRNLVFRFMDMVRLNNERAVMFQSLLHLFVTIADMEKPKSDAVAKQIDIRRVANQLQNEISRVNLLNYVDTLA